MSDTAKNFAGQNLLGRNFKKQDLSGANFSYADIRGANFTGAKLRDANFTGAKAGLQKRWITLNLITFCIISNFLWFFCVAVGFFVLYFFEIMPMHVAITTLITFFVSFLAITIQGYTTATFRTITLAWAGALIWSIAITEVVGDTADIAQAMVFTLAGNGAEIIAIAIAGAGAITIVGLLPVVEAWGRFEFLSLVLVGNVIVVVNVALYWADRNWASSFLSLISIFPEFLAEKSEPFSSLAKCVVGGVIVLSIYTAWRAWERDPKFNLILETALDFAAIGGTSFRDTDLTGANFTGVWLKSTDFQRAILTRTRFSYARKSDRARFGGTILFNPLVRDLVVSLQGSKISFASLNLKGANLDRADLSDANLSEADISEATLQGASLECTNLTKTQALGANFNAANLTGACLEAWNIDSTTKLDGAICEYAYLLNGQQERRPSSGSFAPGEFTKLFEEVFNTVDLIFRNGIDWKAFTYSFQKVQVGNEDIELSIQSIENKGDGVVVVKVNVPPDANKAKIHSEFTENYEVALKALEAKYQSELKAKDDQIVIYRQQSVDMKEIVTLLAARPVTVPVSVDVKATAESKSMSDSIDQSRNVNIGGNVTGSTVNLGEISGSVANTINQLPDDPKSDEPGIKALLTQLQEAIDADPQMSNEDKADALEQVAALAKAVTHPKEEEKQGLAAKAMRALKRIVDALPKTTSLVVAGVKLLPVIKKFFGLP